MSKSRFLQVTLYTLWRHIDKNSAAINNSYMDFVQTRGLILLVNDNHVDNHLKEILLYVNFDPIVFSRLQNDIM